MKQADIRAARQNDAEKHFRWMWQTISKSYCFITLRNCYFLFYSAKIVLDEVFENYQSIDKIYYGKETFTAVKKAWHVEAYVSLEYFEQCKSFGLCSEQRDHLEFF